MPRDSADTRQRLLDAAAAEFATFGIAGARVDRIAEQAGANKSLIYTYFGNKEQLFDAVFGALVVDTVEDVPIDASDLGGYAGRLFDRQLRHPEVLRLALWNQLERGDLEGATSAIAESNHGKTVAISRAQQDGLVSKDLAAEDILALTIATTMIGFMQGAAVEPAAVQRIREAVVTAVRKIAAP